MEILSGIGNNRIIWVTFTAWFVAQLLKVGITLILDKHLDLLRIVGSGGMPSSHASFVISLATAIGKIHGWDSSIFALSLVVALVVMYDAAGVRYAVGRQAVILNQIIEDMYYHRQDKENTQRRLKELIGHTPFEVLAGAMLGIAIAWLLI